MDGSRPQTPNRRIYNETNLVLLEFDVPKGPKLNQSQPITYFHHACKFYVKSCRKLSKRRNRANVMDVMIAIEKMLSTLKMLYLGCNSHLPVNARWNPFQELLLAKCVSMALRQLPGTEEEQEAAMVLFATFEATRNRVLYRAIENAQGPYDDLRPVLNDFAAAWDRFANLHPLPHNAGSIQECLEKEHEKILSLFESTIIDSIEQNLFTRDQLLECDPALVTGLPRLVVLEMLLRKDYDFKQCLWFGKYTETLEVLKKKMNLDKEDLCQLKSTLVNGNDQASGQIGWLHIQISRIADEVSHKKALCLRRVLKSICQQ